MNNQENLCDALAVVLVLNTVWGLYSAGSGSPSEDWGKLVLPLQKQVLCFSVLHSLNHYNCQTGLSNILTEVEIYYP